MPSLISLESSLQIEESEADMETHRFRGQKKTDNKWIYGDLITPIRGSGTLDTYIREKKGHTEQIYYGTEGLFIGLKDKNDKEIYEGDILNCGVCKGSVKMSVDAAGYVIDVIDHAYELPLTVFNFDDFEIIGNIHESKEFEQRKEMNRHIANSCRLKMIGYDSRSWQQLAVDYGYGNVNVMVNEFVKTYPPKYRHFVITRLHTVCSEFTVMHEILWRK